MKDYTRVIKRYGGDILASGGMRAERRFMQHGSVSTYDHSIAVTKACLYISDLLHIKTNKRSLVRGALLHDYYLYDWHKPHDGHDLHAFSHAGQALKNAQCDFKLNKIERDMIAHHMFPLNISPPKCRESVILCVADKICAARETAAGIAKKLGRGI